MNDNVSGLKWNSPNPTFWAVNRHFKPNLLNLRMTISSKLLIRSIRNLKGGFRFRSTGRLRGWSGITKYLFNMADGCHLGFSTKRNNSAVIWGTFMKIGRNINSYNRKMVIWSKRTPEVKSRWSSEPWLSKLGYSWTCSECCRQTLNRKEQLRHRAVSLRQHGFLALNPFRSSDVM